MAKFYITTPVCYINDHGIIMDIYKKLNSRGLIAKLNVEKSGTNKDFWRVNVNQKNSLEKLLGILKNSVKHQKRCRDLKIALKNIKERSKK